VAAAPPGLCHSWPEANSLGVRVENHTGLRLVCLGVRVGGFLKLDVLLCLNPCHSAPLYIPSPSLLASILPSHPLAFGAKPRARAGLLAGHRLLSLLRLLAVLVLCSGPGPSSCSSLNFWLKLKVSENHLPSLPSAKLLALASRWPLLLALTSRRSIPSRQFASTSPQSSWTI